jgi:hypothetical protein
LLEAQSKAGRVVIRFAPEKRQVELLSSCRAGGAYRYVPITRQDESLALHDKGELQAQLPIGAARFEADLERSGQLVVKTSVVGLYTSDAAVTRAELRGEDCDRATHVVKVISVGVFTCRLGRTLTPPRALRRCSEGGPRPTRTPRGRARTPAAVSKRASGPASRTRRRPTAAAPRCG